MSKLKIALVGCGGIMNAHVNGLLTFDDIEVVAVADPRPERTEGMMKRTGATTAYSCGKELLEKEAKLDAAFICIEPTAHNGIEETCIARGIPFLVEKPMTLDMAQGKAISEAVAAKGLVTAVGFQDRYLDLTDRMKQELENMKVGLVYASWLGGIPGVWWWVKKDTCGGQLYEQNIHIVDQLRYFFGEAEKVYATCGRGLVNPSEVADTLPAYETDDFSTATVTFKSGVVANIMSCCYITKQGTGIRNGITVIGRDKSFEYKLRDSLTIYSDGIETRIPRKIDQMARLDRAFLDAVVAKDPTAVRSPYADGYKSLLLANAANESMATGQVVYL